MVKKRKKALIRGSLVPVLLALSLFIILQKQESKANVEEYNVVTNSYYLWDVNDDIQLEMSNGTITIEAKSIAAAPSTAIRYQTIGFGVSLSTQDKNNVITKNGETYYGYTEPANVGILWLADAEKHDRGTTDGINKTEFIFSAEKINKILLAGGLDLNKISNSTKFYLNTVFQSYEQFTGDTKVIRTGKIVNGKGGIDSWEEMMKAEPWSIGSLEGFAKYYNIPIEFSPGPQPNTIHIDYLNTDGNIVSTNSEYYKYNINSKVKWGDEIPTSVVEYKGKQYALKGCYVEAKLKKENVTIRGETSWYDTTKTPDEILAWIKSGKVFAYEPLGGMDIHVVYKEIGAYKNYLSYKCNGVEKKASDLATLEAGKTLSWKKEASALNIKLDTEFGKGTYKLQYYEVYQIEGKKYNYIRTRHIEDATSLDAFLSQTEKVLEGGLKILFYYTSDGQTPTVTPPPIPSTITPTPEPTIPPLITPKAENVSKKLDSVEVVGVIRADVRDAERFNVLSGIPSTESLYTQVKATSYNIGYSFNKKVAVIEYPIKVSKVFVLKWTDAKNKAKVYTQRVTIEQTVTVKRACAYWEIMNFDYYRLSNAVIYNNALPGGSSTMYANYSYYPTPDIVSNHTDSKDYHIIPPKQYKDGIVLTEETLPTGNGVKPIVAAQNFTYIANQKTDEIQVRSDYLSFNGSVIMDNSIYVRETPALSNLSLLNKAVGICDRNVFYQSDQIIPELTLNDIYHSKGTLTYANSPYAISPSSSTDEVPITGLDNVIVHTPVICDASIRTTNVSTGINSNNPYVQTLKVDDDCIQLVIDPDSKLSDFTVDIDNYGKHLGIVGYFTRDFAWGIRDNKVSYIAKKNDIYRNEVKFPFDVFYRSSSGKDEFIPKDTWMRFGHSTPTFYLPMWVNEGIYNVQFRTIAVNGVNTENQLDKTQKYANTDRSNYVATDTIRVQVSGRLYGLTIYDVTDYPTWETVFRSEKGSAVLKLNIGSPSGVSEAKYNVGYAYDYAVGLADQYGNLTGRLSRFTLPLVNGSHPKYTNVGILKTGYAVKFKLTATGNAFSSGDSVLIKPKFYYVDSKGKNRREVDIYYTENFNGKSHSLVKMGSSLDLTNLKSYECGNLYLGIPTAQLKIMAGISKLTLEKYKWKSLDLFSYTTIRIRSPLMTYTNTDYLQNIKNSTQYSAIKTAGITETDIVRRMQTFYAEYFFPAQVKAVEKGFDVYGYSSKYGVGKNESFWLKGGYIIVNFDIVTEDSEGNKNLSYINSSNTSKGYCSMWSMENPVTFKVSYNGKKEKATEFGFLPGDFMVYYTDMSIRDDYSTYIID